MSASKIVDALKEDLAFGVWKQVQSKNPKPQKLAITKYSLDKSASFGISNGRRGGVLLIRGLKSKFCNHPYKFGDDQQKEVLGMTIAAIEQKRSQDQNE